MLPDKPLRTHVTQFEEQSDSDPESFPIINEEVDDGRFKKATTKRVESML